LEKKKVSEIHLLKDNPRIVSRKGLKLLEESYDKFGSIQPIVINKRTNRLLAGHQRLKIFKRKGLKEIDAWIIDQPEEHEMTICLALNNHAGEFDTAKLGRIVSELKEMEDGLKGTLLEDEHVEEIMRRTLPELLDDDTIIEDNSSITTSDTESPQIDVSKNFIYDLYFENPTDKIKFNAYIREQLNKRPYIKHSGDILNLAFKET
jgi:ParB-like chromosome segregation protein Spo0J